MVSSQLCSYSVAFTGTYSPFTGIGPDSVSWPISFPAFPPQSVPLTTATRTVPGVPVFVRETGDAVVTSQTDSVSYGSPTNTPYSLRALFSVQSRQADIFVPFVGVADGDVLVEYRNAAGAVVGGARCVGVACVRTPFAAPVDAVTLYISLKATSPVTISSQGYVDWLGSSVAPILSGGPTFPATTSTTSNSTTTTSTSTPTTPTTVAGKIEVPTGGFTSGLIDRRNRGPLGLYYAARATAPNRTVADLDVSCDGSPQIVLNTPGTGELACQGVPNQVNTITVTDKLGVYASVNFRWFATYPPPPLTVVAGEDLVLLAPPNATNVSVFGGTCDGTRCLIPGANVQPIVGPVLQRRIVGFQVDGAPGLTDYQLQVVPAPTTTGPTTTMPVTTLPPTTAPPLPGVLRVSAPSTAVFGQPITVTVAGATPSTGRIDLSIGGGSVGSVLVNASGSATFTVTPWVIGPTTIMADWVRYVGGKPVSTKVSVPLVVSIDGVPVTTAPPTTAPPTTALVTTSPPSGTLRIVAPGSVVVGKTLTINVSGATQSTGRIDLRIGSGSAGSLAVDAAGSVTFNVAAWVLGQTTLTVDWVRYENGNPITVTASVPIAVRRPSSGS